MKAEMKCWLFYKVDMRMTQVLTSELEHLQPVSPFRQNRKLIETIQANLVLGHH